jgi:hypothetical protein
MVTNYNTKFSCILQTKALKQTLQVVSQIYPKSQKSFKTIKNFSLAGVKNENFKVFLCFDF